ncbi:MAG TPA: hypothetical protein VFX70_10935 [Mycobacteriales bacterium]|nr:hypothetical protein [Mycobacteriales bacterium]
MAEASAGETSHPTRSAPWQSVRAAGSLLATLSAVPYALFVLAVPLSLVTPQVVRDVGLSSTTTLARAITAGTCGVLLAGVFAAGAVGRRIPAHLVSLAGLVVLSAAALWIPSVSSLGELALARAAQGAGAGAVLVATLATAAGFGPRRGHLLTGAWALSAVVATALAPWATYRLPFLPAEGWRSVLRPYPWLLALALVGTAVVVLTSLGSRSHRSEVIEPVADPEADPLDRADGHAGRLGWPLLLPAGIAVAAYLIRPSLYSAGGTATLYSLLLGTALVVVALAGVALARSAGWRWGAAPPVVAVAAAVLTVTGSNAFTLALFDGAGHWPLATGHVFPALGGAALGGGLATIAGRICPRRSRPTLTVAGLLLAAAGSFLPLSGGVALTAAGTIVVWVGVGLALGAVLGVTGPVAAGWLGAGFAVVGTLASVQQSAVRTEFTTRAVPAGGGSDATSFLRTGFTDAHQAWIVISGVLLVLVALLVAWMARRRTVPTTTDSGEPGDTSTLDGDMGDIEDLTRGDATDEVGSETEAMPADR